MDHMMVWGAKTLVAILNVDMYSGIIMCEPMTLSQKFYFPKKKQILWPEVK